MDPGLDGGELRPAREDQGRHQRDLERRQPLRGSHGAEQEPDGDGRDGDGRDVAQAGPDFAAVVDGEGTCSIHGPALCPGLMQEEQRAVLDESAVSHGSPIGAGRHAHAGLEDPVEVALVEEAAGGGDIARRLALPQQPGRGAEAPVEEIGMRASGRFPWRRRG